MRSPGSGVTSTNENSLGWHIVNQITSGPRDMQTLHCRTLITADLFINSKDLNPAIDLLYKYNAFYATRIECIFDVKVVALLKILQLYSVLYI